MLLLIDYVTVYLVEKRKLTEKKLAYLIKSTNKISYQQ